MDVHHERGRCWPGAGDHQRQNPLDTTSIPSPSPKTGGAACAEGIDRAAGGSSPSGFAAEGLAPDVRSACTPAADALAQRGPRSTMHLCRRHLRLSRTTYRAGEASATSARYDGVRYGLRVDAPTTGR